VDGYHTIHVLTEGVSSAVGIYFPTVIQKTRNEPRRLPYRPDTGRKGEKKI